MTREEIYFKPQERIEQMTTFQIEPIGYLIIHENLKLAIYKPINRFHIFMMKLCFGWTYEPLQKGGKDE